MDLKETFGDWYIPLKDTIESDYFRDIPKQLGKKYNPVKSDIFKAFTMTQLKDVRVIILGQNPYPNKAHASGLAFGVHPTTIDVPPSLVNIIREVETDVDMLKLDFDVTLESWAKQGVFLLNTALTTTTGEINNVHRELWAPFTKEVFRVLQEKHTGLVFILWGNEAKRYKEYINPHQYIIESVHPSPLSAYRGFFGSKPFSRTNHILKSINNYEIKW